jgi:DNA-binding MarR family transcriptional regulator
MGGMATQARDPRPGRERGSRTGSARDPGPSAEPGPQAGPPGRGPGNSFLLAQLGAHAGQRFAQRISELSLTPAQAGLLRLVAWSPGQSQQAIARQLGTPPSRLVLLVDGLEERGLIERRRNPGDRRHHALYLTEDGVRFMAELGRIGGAHEADLMTGLSPQEQDVLHGLLTRLAETQGLAVGVHPGYRGARKGAARDGQATIEEG